MILIRKHSVAWLLVLTALAASSVGSSFIYLRDEFQTDTAYIKSHLHQIADSYGMSLTDARKAGWSDEAIAEGLGRANESEFDHRWYRILAIVGALYLVSVLGVFAVMFHREATVRA